MRPLTCRDGSSTRMGGFGSRFAAATLISSKSPVGYPLPWLHQCARGTHQPPPITVRPVAADGGTAIRGRSVVDEETFAGFCILRAADESLAGRSEEGVVVYGCEARVLARLPFR